MSTELMPEDDLVLVRRNSGGVLPDGTTNHPPIDFGTTPRTVTAEGLRIAGAIGAGDLWLRDATVLMEPSPEYDDWLREGPATVRSMLASIRPLALTPSDPLDVDRLADALDNILPGVFNRNAPGRYSVRIAAEYARLSSKADPWSRNEP